MGSKAPAFIGDVKTFSFVRNRGLEVSMPCNAQGHPVPITRYQNNCTTDDFKLHVLSQFTHNVFIIISNPWNSHDFRCDYSDFFVFEMR